jgi:hypothetical protein
VRGCASARKGSLLIAPRSANITRTERQGPQTLGAFASTALLLMSAALHAAEPPELMEGLWSVHRRTTDNPGNKQSESTFTLCRSHAYDKHALEIAKAMNHCVVNASAAANKFSVTTHCLIAGTMIDSASTATYTGNTSVRSETRATYSPALGNIGETMLVQDEKHLGSCPAGLRPGDMTRADGKVVHLWRP